MKIQEVTVRREEDYIVISQGHENHPEQWEEIWLSEAQVKKLLLELQILSNPTLCQVLRPKLYKGGEKNERSESIRTSKTQ